MPWPTFPLALCGPLLGMHEEFCRVKGVLNVMFGQGCVPGKVSVSRLELFRLQWGELAVYVGTIVANGISGQEICSGAY